MKVLFMCTHNSCRSILSEALFNALAPAGFSACSSGSFPSGRVNPLTFRTLARAGIEIEGLRSKSSNEFEQDPPAIVITVCDKAAGEACPVYFGNALRAHWGLEDPSQLSKHNHQLSDAEIDQAFDNTLAIIRQRLLAFFALPFESLDAQQLHDELKRIGEI
jgi:arsenate reductase